jgi:hypothetical protein
MIRKENQVPGIIEGGTEPPILVQTSIFPIQKLQNTTGFLEQKMKMIFENGESILVRPVFNQIHRFNEKPMFVHWRRLNPILKKKKKAPKEKKFKVFNDTISLGHPILTFPRYCKSIAAREIYRKRRLTHIHDQLGIPKAVMESN